MAPIYIKNKNLGIKYVGLEEIIRPQLPVELYNFLNELTKKIIIRGLAYKGVIVRVLLEMYFKDQEFQKIVESNYNQYKEFAYKSFKEKGSKTFIVRIPKELREELNKIRRLKKRYIMDLVGACVYTIMKLSLIHI